METPEHVPWAAFLDQLDWRQGEHFTLLGPTGCGKTTFGRAILHRRQYVCALATKPHDPTLDALRRDGYGIARDWPPRRPRRAAYLPSGQLAEWRVLLWPKLRDMGDIRRQREVFDRALRAMFVERGWCIFADELRYLAKQLGLQSHFELLWLQGRALDISLVVGTQRPAWIPREAYSQATHLALWRNSDEADLRRLSDISGDHGHSPRELRALVAGLPHHHVLYLHAINGTLLTTTVQR